MPLTETQSTTRTKLALSLGGLGVVFLVFAVVQFSGGSIFKPPTRSTVIACPTITDAPSVLAIRDPEKDALQIALADGTSREIAQLVRQKHLSLTDPRLGVRLGELATRRKQALIATMVANPSEALRTTLAPHEAGVLERSTKNCLERQTSVEGSLQVTHADFDDGSSANEYAVITNADEKILLYPSNLSHDLQTGMQIRATGLRLDSHLLVDDSNDVTLSTPFSSQQGIEVVSDVTMQTAGEQRLLVLIANFTDTPQPVATRSEIQQLLYDPATRSTDQYFREASYGTLWFNGVNNPQAGSGLPGDVYGDVIGNWLPLGRNADCYVEAIITAAMNAAETSLGENAIDFTRYQYIMVIAPIRDPCGFSGIAMGQATITTPDGPVSLRRSLVASTHQALYNYTAAHELGHNIGLQHATAFYCGPRPYSMIDTDCRTIEYGGFPSVMGSSSSHGHLDAVHKEHLGWLGAPGVLPHEIFTVENQTGRYTLRPMSSSQPGLKALRMQRTTTGYLYVEYRQPLGFDDELPTIPYLYNVYDGAILHLRNVPSSMQYSDLLYAEASSQTVLREEPWGFLDAERVTALTPGYVHPDLQERGFLDPATGTRVEVVSNTVDAVNPDNSRLVVDVTLGAGADFEAPNVTITQPAADTTVSGAVDIRATVTDNREIDQVEFSISAGGFSQSATVTGPINGDVYGVTIDTSHLPNGTANVYVRAWDGVGNERALGNRVFIANTDTQPPSVTITAPTDGAIVTNNPVPFAADASDAVGIWKVEFYQENFPTPFLVDASSPFGGSLYVTPGTITLRARAYDFVGNTTEHAITFTVPDTTPPVVYITFPIPGTTISGITNFRIGAYDSVGVIWIELYREGRNFPIVGRAPDAQSTIIPVDTRTLQNGNVVFFAKAYDAARNSQESYRITLNVTNTEPPPPKPIPPDEWVP